MSSRIEHPVHICHREELRRCQSSMRVIWKILAYICVISETKITKKKTKRKLSTPILTRTLLYLSVAPFLWASYYYGGYQQHSAGASSRKTFFLQITHECVTKHSTRLQVSRKRLIRVPICFQVHFHTSIYVKGTSLRRRETMLKKNVVSIFLAFVQ